MLTFDTDVLRDYLDPSREHHQLAENLVRLDQERLCEICLIIRFAADVPQGHLRDRLDKPEICQRPRIGTFAPWDVSEWDADFWASDEDQEIHLKMFDLIFPGADPDNKSTRFVSPISDISLSHALAKRHLVIRDRAILD